MNELSLDELKQMVAEHFAAVKSLIRYNKEKDANLAKLSKQLQVYRDGMEQTMFKRIALEVISLREDCVRAINDYKDRELSAENCKKYLGYVPQDYADMMERIGVAVDGQVTYNGKPLEDVAERVNFSEPEEPAAEPVTEPVAPTEQVAATDTCEEQPAEEQPQSFTTEQFVQYLKSCEEQIAALLAQNKTLDVLLSDYVNANALYEQGVYQVVLYPVIRRIANGFGALQADEQAMQAQLAQLQNDDQGTEQSSVTPAQIYVQMLEKLYSQCDVILEMCGVCAEKVHSNVYDPRKQRVLKLIPTEEESLNGLVADSHSDCYVMNEKVIYPAKVDLYKLK